MKEYIGVLVINTEVNEPQVLVYKDRGSVFLGGISEPISASNGFDDNGWARYYQLKTGVVPNKPRFYRKEIEHILNKK